MPPVAIERVVKRFRFDHADTAATHRVIKHPVHLLPRTRFLIVGNIVKDGGVSEFAFERAAEEWPERARDRSAIDSRSGGRNPDHSFRIGVTQLVQERHRSAVGLPAGVDRAAEVAPGAGWFDGLRRPDFFPPKMQEESSRR